MSPARGPAGSGPVAVAVAAHAEPGVHSALALALFAGIAAVFIHTRRRTVHNRRKRESIPRFYPERPTPERPGIGFGDVAGCSEAKAELSQIADYLRTPERFQRLGARAPRGVLLCGPPGTGKTLMARAIAGEAGVPFFAASGAEFVEMYVGVGAARVRELFTEARNCGPCLVFIDEIDALGRARSGQAGGSEEREATLNQLLIAMDGFAPSSQAIVIAATNRPELLDSALLRPGRFDRQVHLGLPDLQGRAEILRIYLNRLCVGSDVDVETLARSTSGYAGADLEALCNDAALQAAQWRQEVVSMAAFDSACDRRLLGLARPSLAVSPADRELIAYHEAGHAIVAHALAPDADPVHRITITPTGQALGATVQLPLGERFCIGRARLDATMTMLCAGRAAEELFLNQSTTGAMQDFQRATAIAQDIVFRYGMGETLGPMVADAPGARKPRGLSAGDWRAEASQGSLWARADEEVKALVDRAMARARGLLEQRPAQVHGLAQALLQQETLNAAEFLSLMRALGPQGDTEPSPTDQ